jgi:hypothetical protein
MSYFEGHLAGEHEEVWAELVALGEAVRDASVYSDALAVARETMHRVRWNIETLAPRLRAVGYEFGYGCLVAGSLLARCWLAAGSMLAQCWLA